MPNSKSRKSLRLLWILAAALAVFASGQKVLRAQEPQPSPTREAVSETDPTKPILWVVRNEFRDLKNGAWANTVLLRHDRFTLRNLRVKGGGKGFVLRFDLPFNTVHLGTETKAGLGDIYVQALLIPRITRKFAFSVGTGVVLPTATNDLLGQGKLIIAPVAVPLWYLAKRKRLVTLRFQHYVSIAGKSSRADVNYSVVDPVVAWALGRKSWVFTNTEVKWDWRTKQGSAITGIQFGRMVSDKLGFWVKPEVPWGEGRQGGFNIKVGFFRFQ